MVNYPNLKKAPANMSIPKKSTSKHYTVTIMYNNEKEIVQWYIDITNMNGIDSDERIFYDDLYLSL